MTAPADLARGQVRTERRVRDPFLDNAKFLLIVLVVVGHNWVPALDDSRAVKAAYMVVYSFHVPAFVLLCGYFSRGFEGRRDQWRKLVTTVLVPYLVFQTAYAAVTSWVADEPFSLHLSGPIYVCWFLLALFFWRASAPLLKSLPHPILISIAVSLVTGVTITDTGFALSRTLQLLPWFAIGLFLEQRHFALLRQGWVRVAAVPVVVAAALTAYALAPSFDVRWFDREWSADALGVSPVVDVVFALGLHVVTAVMIVAALALVPRSRSLLTALGAFTMYPFLLHGLVVRTLQHFGVHSFLIDQGALGIAAITAGAIVLPFLLATPWVRTATRWAVEPASIRLRRRSQAVSQEAARDGAAQPAEQDRERVAVGASGRR
ncbi:acyltransferase family protein [Amnibacterium soli]|uniref:Acyltransferase family protein n=1 Tax=Amnibacterium soli TaxID=1282736 RepID=A0ABP8YPN8_9MICO